MVALPVAAMTTAERRAALGRIHERELRGS
jgi:hypothetical protein